MFPEKGAILRGNFIFQPWIFGDMLVFRGVIPLNILYITGIATTCQGNNLHQAIGNNLHPFTKLWVGDPTQVVRAISWAIDQGACSKGFFSLEGWR